MLWSLCCCRFRPPGVARFLPLNSSLKRLLLLIKLNVSLFAAEWLCDPGCGHLPESHQRWKPGETYSLIINAFCQLLLTSLLSYWHQILNMKTGFCCSFSPKLSMVTLTLCFTRPPPPPIFRSPVDIYLALTWWSPSEWSSWCWDSWAAVEPSGRTAVCCCWWESSDCS